MAQLDALVEPDLIVSMIKTDDSGGASAGRLNDTEPVVQQRIVADALAFVRTVPGAQFADRYAGVELALLVHPIFYRSTAFLQTLNSGQRQRGLAEAFALCHQHHAAAWLGQRQDALAHLHQQLSQQLMTYQATTLSLAQ